MDVDNNKHLIKIMRITSELWEFENIQDTIKYFCEAFCGLEGCLAVVVHDSSGEFYRAKREFFGCKYLDYKPASIKVIYPEECHNCNMSHKALLIQPITGRGAVYIFTDTSDQLFLAGLSYAVNILSKVLEEKKMREKLRQILFSLESNIQHFQYLSDRLRNPLSTIIGVLELKDELPEEKVFKMIMDGAKKIWNVLDQLNDSEENTRNIFSAITSEYTKSPLKWSNIAEKEDHRFEPTKAAGYRTLKDLLIMCKSNFASEKLRFSKIPEDLRSKVLVAKWVEFLIKKVGRLGLEEVLDYYVEVGWINESFKHELMKLAEGLRHNVRSDYEMSVRDHLISLMFINMLKAKNQVEILKNRR